MNFNRPTRLSSRSAKQNQSERNASVSSKMKEAPVVTENFFHYRTLSARTVAARSMCSMHGGEAMRGASAPMRGECHDSRWRHRMRKDLSGTASAGICREPERADHGPLRHESRARPRACRAVWRNRLRHARGPACGARRGRGERVHLQRHARREHHQGARGRQARAVREAHGHHARRVRADGGVCRRTRAQTHD